MLIICKVLAPTILYVSMSNLLLTAKNGGGYQAE